MIGFLPIEKRNGGWEYFFFFFCCSTSRRVYELLLSCRAVLPGDEARCTNKFIVC